MLKKISSIYLLKHQGCILAKVILVHILQLSGIGWSEALVQQLNIVFLHYGGMRYL